MKSTKTGDAPYRNLLDLFVQDFLTCLSSIDWPAAELLLRVFLIRMLKLAENEKTPAPAKNMALDVLAEMGAAISQLNSNVRKPIGTLEGADAETELGGASITSRRCIIRGQSPRIGPCCLERALSCSCRISATKMLRGWQFANCNGLLHGRMGFTNSRFIRPH